MAERRLVQLGSLAAREPGAIAIGPFGSRMKADVYVPDGVPVIRGVNISQGREWKGDWVFVPETFAEEMPNCVASAGDLVLPHRGAIGEVALVPDDGVRYMLSTSFMKFRADAQQACPAYLLYYFRSQSGREEILRFASQVGTPGIGQPLSSLRQFRVLLPPLAEQRAIADLLGTLDDKIALNARMNATLEAMARAVFEDWFVRFGPVRAKAEGRAPPGLAPDLAALFPDRLTETPDGEVPDGWAFCSLGDICTLQRGFDLPKDQRREGSVPVVSSSGVTGFHSEAPCQPPGVVTGRYGTIGEVFWLDTPFWPLNTALFVADFKGHSAQFVFHTLRGVPFDQFSDKAAVPGINRNHLHQARVVRPPAALVTAFETTVDPLQRRRSALDAESRTLTALRDLLLPRLISGRLRLRDAERALEAAL